MKQVKLVCFLVFSSAVMLAAAMRVRAETATNLPSYAARIAATQRELADIAGGEPLTASQVDSLYRSLPLREQIVHRGQVYNVDHGWLRNMVQTAQHAGTPEERDRALQALRGSLLALQREMETAMHAGSPFDPNLSRRLEEILSRHEFQVKKGETLFERAMNWIANMLRKLLGFIPKAGSNSERVLKVVIVFVAAGLILYLSWLLWRHLHSERAAKRKGARVVLGEEIGPEVSTSDLVSAALELKAQGDYRGAIRKLYIALLVDFDRRRMIKLTQNATNREYFRAVDRASSSLREAFLFLTDTFEYFWYGKQETRERDFDQFYGEFQKISVHEVERPAA